MKYRNEQSSDSRWVARDISWGTSMFFFFFFLSTKIAKECIKAGALGPVPIAGMTGASSSYKYSNMYAFCSQGLDSSPKPRNLECLFAHNVSTFWSPCQTAPWHTSKSVEGGKQTKNLWSVDLSVSLSLSLFCLWIFSSGALRQTNIFSGDKLLLFEC